MTAIQLGEALSNSLSLSSILVLTAMGLAITFGVMRVINMAHGDMLMLGAYTAFVVTDDKLLPAWINSFLAWCGLDWHVELNLFHAIPIVFVVVGFIGYLTEVFLIRHLYGRPLDTLLATWGLGLIFQQVINLTFGEQSKTVRQPLVLQGSRTIGDLTIPDYRLFIVGFTLLCLLLVYLLFYQTSLGLKIRAVVQNRSMASALGISTRRVDSMTFAIATGLAGVAGCILGAYYKVTYTMGNDYVVEAFMVVILGGMGQLAGSVGGAVVIGLGTGFVEKLVSQPQMAKVIVLATVVAFLLIRPAGLFAVKERSYE